MSSISNQHNKLIGKRKRKKRKYIIAETVLNSIKGEWTGCLQSKIKLKQLIQIKKYYLLYKV